jgi:hypothetical protein
MFTSALLEAVKRRRQHQRKLRRPRYAPGLMLTCAGLPRLLMPTDNRGALVVAMEVARTIIIAIIGNR